MGCADSDARKPTVRCVPSQNGLRCEWPQRHNENGRFGNFVLITQPVDERHVVALD